MQCVPYKDEDRDSCPDPLTAYLTDRIALLLDEKEKISNNMKRLEVQRNELNAKVYNLNEEIRHLLEPEKNIGTVAKLRGNGKVVVHLRNEGKYIVKVSPDVKYTDLRPSSRVALESDSRKILRILPKHVDPLVSLMKVEKAPDATYDMIGGLDKQITELKEVIELPIKFPELFESLGIEQPKGVILYGPPGTGKTLLARAVAHHTDSTFIRVSGGELVQKYIGEGSRLVRELFVMARQHAPSIIFIDEVDSIGGTRGGGERSDSEVQRTMLELLNQLDGFEPTENIKIIMATNRIDMLDSALLRPGRIDRKIEIPNPDTKGREDILKIHSRRMNVVRGVDLAAIAAMMDKSSGADLKAVCSEAGMFALRERRTHVTQQDFEMAVVKVKASLKESGVEMSKMWK